MTDTKLAELLRRVEDVLDPGEVDEQKMMVEVKAAAAELEARGILSKRVNCQIFTAGVDEEGNYCRNVRHCNCPATPPAPQPEGNEL